jgi:hypothetical protein
MIHLMLLALATTVLSGPGPAGPGPARAAQITVVPATGTGRAGDAVLVRGADFPASATVFVTIGEPAAGTADRLADRSGSLPALMVLIERSLPAGRHRVAARAPGASASAFFNVRPYVTLDPPMGDGEAGATWRTNRAIAEGGRMGMVFLLSGTGFPKGLFLAADSIRMGRARTIHDPIRIGPDGILNSATVIVAERLSPGRYDLAFQGGSSPLVFASVFHVAPWAASDAMRQRDVRGGIETAKLEMRRLISFAGDLLPADEASAITQTLKDAERDLADANMDSASDLSSQAAARLEELKGRMVDARKERMRAVADVVASGFDALQPAGAPAPREGSASITRGRQKLEQALQAIDQGRLDDAKRLLKESNDLLKKARSESGVKAPEEQIRW